MCYFYDTGTKETLEKVRFQSIYIWQHARIPVNIFLGLGLVDLVIR